MKKFGFFILLFVALSVYGQGNSGFGFNYQAVVRGADGFVLPSASVELRFSLLPGQYATEASWVETHNVTTDTYGVVGVTVGKGVKAGGIVATFANVNFAAVHYWLKVEIKEGGDYRELSYSALASVPYAEPVSNAVSAPVGSVMPFAGSADNVPAGWLLCDGSEANRSLYAALYAVIGTAWGFGDNATTFNLPDMRDVFGRGVAGASDTNADADARTPLKEGGNSGNKVGSYQSDAIRNITGQLSVGAGSGSLVTATGVFFGSNHSVYQGMYYHNGNQNVAAFDASRVVPTGADNRPVNVYVYKIIKY
jgi:microcystin-dependent protein